MAFFSNPSDSYLFGVMAAFMERMTIERAPNLRQKIYYVVFTNLGRFMLVSPSQNMLYIANLAAMALSIVQDISRESVIKNLFFSYANYKKSYTKFKDLLVQDIPEGVLIISKDLTHDLFVNNSFQEIAGYRNLADMKKCLYKFKIQSDNLPSNSTMTLLDLLETQQNIIFNNKQNKLSINLEYIQEENLTTTSTRDNNINPGRIFEAKILPIVWDEQPSLALILHDITQQQTILSLQLADMNKDMVLATISHELRTPLNAMMGMIQIMQKRVQDLEMLHYLSICKNSGNLLLGLVNSILDLNQIRLNKLRLDVEKVSLHELLNDVVHMFEFQCTQKGLYLRLQTGKSCPQYIVTDRNRLIQVFINLVGNAVKFTSEGGITINVEQDTRKEYLKFIIEDTGIGIRDNEKGKLFKMFGRLEHSDRTLNNHGVGLGLTIANTLVDVLSPENKGHQNIKVSSTYGKGSSFEFSIIKELEVFDCETEDVDEKAREFEDLYETEDRLEKMEKYSTPTINNFSILKHPHIINLPKNLTELEIATTASTLSPKPKFNRSQSSLSVYKSNLSFKSNPKKSLNPSGKDYVLLIDDNPFNLVVAEQLVSSHGFKVKSALSGQSGIRMVIENQHTEEPIKLIFMDLQMPVMDGYEATEVLRKLMVEEKIPNIPIVALTANDSPQDKKKCLDVGMSGHLSKPLKDIDLEIMLKKFGS